jgi:outer membrane protein
MIKKGSTLMKHLSLIACSFMIAHVYAKDAKIGCIEPATIIIKCDKWTDLGREAQEALNNKGQKLQAKQQKLQEKMKKLESMGAAASKTARQELEEEVAKLRNEIQIEYESLQATEQRMSQEAQMEIVKDIEDATKQIAQEEDMDMITAGAVVYAKAELNMTDKVLARVNQNYAANKKKSDATVKIAKTDIKKTDKKSETSV